MAKFFRVEICLMTSFPRSMKDWMRQWGKLSSKRVSFFLKLMSVEGFTTLPPLMSAGLLFLTYLTWVSYEVTSSS